MSTFVLRSSSAELQILRRACVLAVEAERIEAEMAVSKPDIATLDVYSRVASSMRRLFESVGLQRRSKTIGESLGSLMAQDLVREREKAEAAPAQIEQPSSRCRSRRRSRPIQGTDTSLTLKLK